MKSIRVIGEARKIGIRIQPRQLFEQRTLQKLADAVDPVKLTKTLSEESHYDAIVPLKSSGWRAPLFCLHSGGGHVFFYQPLAELMPQDRPLYAIQPKGLEGGTDSGNFTSIPEMAEYYLTEIRRIQPEGPYNLLGTCFSNAVALEIVRLLEDADEKVENLFIIDSAPAHLENQVAPHLENRPLINFFNALKRGDWSYLFGRLKKRLIIAGWLVSSINQKEKRSTYETILGLNELYSRHHWKPIEGDISFIRSSEFAGRADKESQPEQWRKLVKGNVQISVVEGEHLTLFKQPFVKGLAARIAEELVDEE